MDPVKKIQEDQYELPYHWFLEPDVYRGRKYYGYTAFAIEMATKHGLDTGTARILDAGCGDGRFIKMLHDANANTVEGLDYSERAVAFGRILLPDTSIFIGDLTDFTTLQGVEKYDCIFLIETLEHIELKHVDTVLNNLKKMLTPDGLLIITVPSTQLPLHKKHYQHFTSTSLSAYVSDKFDLLETVGYASVQQNVLRFVYKLIHNRIWEIKPLVTYFNVTIYPKYLLRTKPDEGEGLMAIMRNKL